MPILRVTATWLSTLTGAAAYRGRSVHPTEGTDRLPFDEHETPWPTPRRWAPPFDLRPK